MFLVKHFEWAHVLCTRKAGSPSVMLVVILQEVSDVLISFARWAVLALGGVCIGL